MEHQNHESSTESWNLHNFRHFFIGDFAAFNIFQGHLNAKFSMSETKW